MRNTLYRFVAVLAGLLVALYPALSLLLGAATVGTVSVAPFLALALVVAVAVVLAVTVARSRSPARLWRFIAVEYVLIVALWLVLELLPRWLGLSAVVQARAGLVPDLAVAAVVYAVSYLLVYGGWGARLRRTVPV